MGIEEHARAGETNNSGDSKDSELDQLETKEVENRTENNQNGGENSLVFFDEFNEEVSGARASITGFTSDSVDSTIYIGTDNSAAEFGSIDRGGSHVALKKNNKLFGGNESTVFTDISGRVGDLEAFSGVGAVDQREIGIGVRDVVTFSTKNLISGKDLLGTIATGDMIISNTESNFFKGAKG